VQPFDPVDAVGYKEAALAQEKYQMPSPTLDPNQIAKKPIGSVRNVKFAPGAGRRNQVHKRSDRRCWRRGGRGRPQAVGAWPQV
jgi:hypothetical protein